MPATFQSGLGHLEQYSDISLFRAVQRIKLFHNIVHLLLQIIGDCTESHSPSVRHWYPPHIYHSSGTEVGLSYRLHASALYLVVQQLCIWVKKTLALVIRCFQMTCSVQQFPLLTIRKKF